ncbi:MAG: hypothetical protein HY827_02225 [Actinobacteria bacterium]|nr:hypothetical protein [Actinomycetota bacterium]
MITHIKNFIGRARRGASSESGFSMLPAMTAVFVGSLISMGAWTAAHGDLNLQQQDRYSKRAYAAAQSGMTDYVQHLSTDSSYWSYCDNPPNGGDPGSVNDTDIGSGLHPKRRWLPASSDESLAYQYTIDLLPVSGRLSCKSSSNRTDTMIDQSTGTFRVRVTGRSGQTIPNTATINPNPANPGSFVAKTAASIEQWRQLRWKRRSIVIDFRRRGFLDFAYLTDQEGMDPTLQSDPAWAGANCNVHYRDGRSYWNGQSGRKECSEIQFGSSDWIKGPFHTNDSINAVSGAKFGNPGKSDRIEISADTCPVRNQYHSGCGSNLATYYGTVVTGANAPELTLPEANEDLAIFGEPANGGYTYYGATKIILKSNVMDVYNNGSWTYNVTYPTSGVIYVAKKVGCTSFDANNNYHFPVNCGSVEIEGTYNIPLTIAAENDIVVTDDVIAAASSPDAVMGLIANEFVRVRHYISGDSAGNITNTTSCTNSGSKRVNEIDAAILALQHSFTVDNYRCGSGLGTLTIKGGLTQKYRGAVGTSGGNTGYLKDYQYDYRLRYLTPPYFLTPSLSGWRISRYREQTPPCSCTGG